MEPEKLSARHAVHVCGQQDAVPGMHVSSSPTPGDCAPRATNNGPATSRRIVKAPFEKGTCHTDVDLIRRSNVVPVSTSVTVAVAAPAPTPAAVVA